MEEELVASEVVDDVPLNQTSDESHTEHGVVVLGCFDETHVGEHVVCDLDEKENHYEADLTTGVAVVAMELARELGPFYVEAETHGAETITIPTSGALIQHGGSIIGDALKEVDGLQTMSLSVFMIEDPSGMGFIESSTTR